MATEVAWRRCAFACDGRRACDGRAFQNTHVFACAVSSAGSGARLGHVARKGALAASRPSVRPSVGVCVLLRGRRRSQPSLCVSCRTGLRDDRLTLVQSGSSSPCLDLRSELAPRLASSLSSTPPLSVLFMCVAAIFSPCSRLDKELAMVVRERRTDLVIVEGMGRAIHTNYYATFSCESLKMAVIKNSWLADRLGGKLFSVVFKYEAPSGGAGQPSAALTGS